MSSPSPVWSISSVAGRNCCVSAGAWMARGTSGQSFSDQGSRRNPGLRVGGVTHRVHRSTGANFHLSTFIVERPENGPAHLCDAARLNNQVAPDGSVKVEV